MELEKSLLASCVYKLKIIEIYNITSDLFMFSEHIEIFENMILQLNKKYEKYHPRENEIEYIRLNILQYKADEKNIMAIVESIKERNAKEKLKKMLETISRNIDKKNIKSTISEINTIGSQINIPDKEEILTTDDFDEEFEKILSGQYKTNSDIMSGYKTLDKKIFGIQRNCTTIFSAPTGYGKTAFALNLTRNVAKYKNVLYINLEMNKKKITERFIQMLGQIEKERFENADIEAKNIVRAAQIEFKKLNLKITNGKPKNVDDIILSIRNSNVNKQLDLVIIDYLGRVSDRENENQKEHLKLKEWVMEINRARSMDQNYHVWILSQLNRNAETMMDSVSGILDGRQTMQGSYNMLAEPDTVYTWYCHKNAGWILHCDKNRDGDDGWDINFQFHKPTQTIRELQQIDLHEFSGKDKGRLEK